MFIYVLYYNHKKDKGDKKKYYLFDCDFRFEIEADDYDKALRKAWAFIHANLPEDFDTEGSELSLINESEI